MKKKLKKFEEKFCKWTPKVSGPRVLVLNRVVYIYCPECGVEIMNSEIPDGNHDETD